MVFLRRRRLTSGAELLIEHPKCTAPRPIPHALFPDAGKSSETK